MKRMNKVNVVLICGGYSLIPIFILAESFVNNSLKFSRLLALLSILPLVLSLVYKMIEKCKLKRVKHKLDVIEYKLSLPIIILIITSFFYDVIVDYIVIPDDWRNIVDNLPNVITAIAILCFFISSTYERIIQLFFSDRTSL